MCDSKDYWPLYNMSVSLDKDRKHETPLTVTQVTVNGLSRIKNLGHKFYTDSIFSCQTFGDLHAETIKCCGTVWLNSNGMLRGFGQKMKLMCGHMKNRVRGNLTAIVWKGKQCEQICSLNQQNVISLKNTEMH